MPGMPMSASTRSGKICFAFDNASVPLSTVTSSMSSLAKVMPTTFWMVTLSSARSSVFGMSPGSPRRSGAGGPAPHDLSEDPRSRLNPAQRPPTPGDTIPARAIKRRRTPPDADRMAAVCSARSDVGCKRDFNEDSFAVEPAVGVFVVADGLGGHVAGRRASETAVQAFLKAFGAANGPAPLAALRLAVRDANRAIRALVE